MILEKPFANRVIPLRNEERMSHGNLLNSTSNRKYRESDEMPKSQTFYESFRKGMTKMNMNIAGLTTIKLNPHNSLLYTK